MNVELFDPNCVPHKATGGGDPTLDVVGARQREKRINEAQATLADALADIEPAERPLTPEEQKELARAARRAEEASDPAIQENIRGHKHAADQREGRYRPISTSHPTADQMIHDF